MNNSKPSQQISVKNLEKNSVGYLHEITHPAFGGLKWNITSSSHETIIFDGITPTHTFRYKTVHIGNSVQNISKGSVHSFDTKTHMELVISDQAFDDLALAPLHGRYIPLNITYRPKSNNLVECPSIQEPFNYELYHKLIMDIWDDYIQRIDVLLAKIENHINDVQKLKKSDYDHSIRLLEQHTANLDHNFSYVIARKLMDLNEQKLDLLSDADAIITSQLLKLGIASINGQDNTIKIEKEGYINV
ncbi:hypothetical protein [Acinetobacter sp. P1(2025)]|uniref:hypothetical protein n=1 Tax=Acinetobacter sp. P1(2025) TaxID=3446120 RepID=UPI003F52EF78